MSPKSHRMLFVATSLALAACSPAYAGKLMMSEIVANEVGGSFTGEWIEIYNGTDAAIDLSNHKIGDEETKLGTSATESMFQFPSGSSIAPGEFQIVSSFASQFLSLYGFRPTYEAGSTVALDGWVDDAAVPNMSIYAAWDADGAKLNMANANDQALFLDGSDSVVDQANWGESTFFFSPSLAEASDGQSWERIDLNAPDTDAAADWRRTPSSLPGAAWASFSSPGAGPLPAVSTWIADGDGAWPISPNWQNDIVPNSGGQTAVFGDVITAARVISLLGNQTVGTLRFDSNFTYTVDGTDRLTFANGGGGVGVQVLRGNHELKVPMTFTRSTTLDVAAGSTLTLSGPITTSVGTAGLAKIGAGSARVNSFRGGAIRVDAGTLTVAAANVDASTSVATSLTIAAGAVLDINDNALVIDYAATATTSPLAAVATAIAEGRLTSSIAQSDVRYGIGTADSATAATLTQFAGITLDATAVVADLTLRGDATLDYLVNFADLVALAKNYNTLEGGTWAKGDSNYDGIVNFSDLVALAMNYNGAATPSGLASLSKSESFAGDWALAQSLVPEPTALLGLIMLSPLARGRRR